MVDFSDWPFLIEGITVCNMFSCIIETVIVILAVWHLQTLHEGSTLTTVGIIITVIFYLAVFSIYSLYLWKVCYTEDPHWIFSVGLVAYAIMHLASLSLVVGHYYYVRDKDSLGHGHSHDETDIKYETEKFAFSVAWFVIILLYSICALRVMVLECQGRRHRKKAKADESESNSQGWGSWLEWVLAAMASWWIITKLTQSQSDK